MAETAPSEGCDARPAEPRACATLTDVLAWHAARYPHRVHARILSAPGAAEAVTYGQLWHDAGEAAGGLHRSAVPTGSSVGIMLPTGRDYLTAFFGVLLAGCVPVPVYPPLGPVSPDIHLAQHDRILEDAAAAVLVTTTAMQRAAVRPAGPRALRTVVTVDELRAAGHGSRPHERVAPEAVALLQYTSGSTSDPKGVVLTHANLLANMRATTDAACITAEDTFVSWLPLHHDMGLIGTWLNSLYSGRPLVLLSPLDFLVRPSRWLKAITAYRGTISGAPNFAYELCLRRITDAEAEHLDLRSWRIAFTGAEPVSADTIARFSQRFGSSGLRPETVTPVYGLAEAAVALTFSPVDRAPAVDHVDREALGRVGRALPVSPEHPGAARFVSCGPPIPGHDVRVVGAAGAVLDERGEGRIQFRGPSATQGYHGQHEANRGLCEGAWLNTGDLGYMSSGELYVTGRQQDTITRAGRSIHPAELEEAIGGVPGVRSGCVAVFGSAEPGALTERLVVVAETRAGSPDDQDRIRADITALLARLVNGPPDDLVLTQPGSVPKTSSGKVRRRAARAGYEAARLSRRAQ